MSFKKIIFEVEKRNLDNTKAYTKEELSRQGYMVPVQTAPSNSKNTISSDDEDLEELVQEIIETKEMSVIVQEDPNLNFDLDVKSHKETERLLDEAAVVLSKKQNNKKPTKKAKKES